MGDWTVRITHYGGLAPGARHYYATITRQGGDYEQHHVMAPISAKEAVTRNKLEARSGFTARNHWEAGEMFEAMESEEIAIKAAVSLFLEVAEPNDVLWKFLDWLSDREAPLATKSMSGGKQ